MMCNGSSSLKQERRLTIRDLGPCSSIQRDGDPIGTDGKGASIGTAFSYASVSGNLALPPKMNDPVHEFKLSRSG